MDKPVAEGVLVTGKQADCVRVTGFGKLGVVGRPREDEGLLDPAAWTRPCEESPARHDDEHY